MGKFIDLTGQRFGKLIVIKRVEDYISPMGDKQVQWLCKCDCGRKTIVASNNLKNKHCTSCRCNRDESEKIHRFTDILGHQFGDLIVVSRDDDFIDFLGRHRDKWLCRCIICDKTEIIFGEDLRYNHIKSCDCSKKEKFKDLTKMIFGQLKVIKYLGLSKWLCKCDCGNEIIAESLSLRAGKTTNCGCNRSADSIIATKLKEYCIKNYSAIPEYKVFRNPYTDYYLPFDIYIPENIFIEINGLQHYQATWFHKLSAETNNTTEEGEYKYQLYKDRLKQEYACQHGTYIEVDLRKIKTVEKAIEYIENNLPNPLNDI